MLENEEAALLRQISSDPDRGLDTAMRRYAGLVQAIAARILPGQPQEVEECLADVFVALWRHAGDLLGRGVPPGAWLVVTARNKALNRRRTLARHAALPLDEEMAAALADAAPLGLDRDPGGERGAAVGALVAALPAPDNEIFLRKYYLLQPSRQIAAALGMTEAAVNTRLCRGRARLRRQLEAAEKEAL